MINDKAILVGVDGSHASYKATWWAANYAKHAGLTLQIVCAYSLPSYAAVSFDATYTAMGDDNAAHSDAQEILSKAKAIADEQGVEASTLIVTGDPASVFVELSRNYNLIVIGNRGKGGLAERFLGTTSSSLPAYAYCPIVVVPYTNDEGEVMHLNNRITKVAVGIDESKWGINFIRFEKSGLGALGFSMYGEFDRIITPEMEAEGWTLANNQFEGGFWYVTVNKTVGAAVYSVRMKLDGSKIFSLSVSVNDLNAHFSAQAE